MRKDSKSKEQIFQKSEIPFDVGLFEYDFLQKKTSLQNVKQFEVKKVSNIYANNFVSIHHYLKRKIYIAKNVSYGIYYNDYCFGVCMFGYPVWKEYPGLVPPMMNSEVPELIRLCTLANLPKNTESFFISKCLKMLKKDWEMETGSKPKCVTSLCDIAFGFNGSIYKATNFNFYRTTKGRATNPGGTHGKWKKNDFSQKAEKVMYVKWM